MVLARVGTQACILFIAVIKSCAQNVGTATFQARNLTLLESAGHVGIPLSRIRGSSGILEATVSVNTTASTMDASDYTFTGGTVRWEDGDTAVKALILSIKDDATYEPTEMLELMISATNGGNGIHRLQVYVQADDDGGFFEFYYGTPGGGVVDLSTSVATVPEGPPASLECLIWAERTGGTSGTAALRVEMDCEAELQDNFATRGIDYDFYPSSEHVQWQEGENDRRCIIYSLPPGFRSPTSNISLESWQGGVVIWPDADQEDLELLCFQMHKVPGSTASIQETAESLRFVLVDGGTQGARTTYCYLGTDCNVSFKGLHWQPGVNISVSQYCNPSACRRWSWPYAIAYNFTIPASDLFTRSPGDWYACRCFTAPEGFVTAAQAVHVISIVGPVVSNVAHCTLGWHTCSVEINGEGLARLPQLLRVFHSCPGLNHSEDEDYVVPGLWEGGLGLLNQSITPGAWFSLADPIAMKSAGPGLFYMCWCWSGEGNSCQQYDDFAVPAGLFVMEGPHTQEELTIVHGSTLEFNISGSGLQANDYMTAIHYTDKCSGSSYLNVTTTDGYYYHFGAVTEEQLPPGYFNLCWCRLGPDVNCQEEDHWTYVSSLKVKCPSNLYNFQEVCSQCWWPWDVPDSDGKTCIMDVLRAVGVTVMFCCTSLSLFIVLCQFEFTKQQGCWRLIGRRVRIQDISAEGEGTKLVMTSLGHHHLHKGCTFPVTFYQTNHFLLDTCTHRAIVLDRFRVEITTSKNEFFQADASGGHLVLSIRGTFWYTQVYQVIPVLILIILLLGIGFGAVSFGNPPLYFALGLAACEISLATLGRFAVWKHQQYRSPLDWRLRQYDTILTEKNPKPEACARGPLRALTAYQLFDLFDFFQAFIKGRNMYYIDPNIVRPLTKKYRLSYAERVGPSQVDYFISHWWGTPFRNFCESVKRHAIHMSHSDDEGQWKKIAYWICTFSNNQYRVKEELGVTHEESSFFKALHSDRCKGTAMIMDEEASLLKRSWCLFELLQTVRKTQSAAAIKDAVESCVISEESKHRFAGMFFCTTTGVLNYGHATVELAMKIGQNIKGLSLEHATATSQEDKDMINRLVLEEMGSYDRINQILRDNLAEALRKCQEEVDGNFESLFKGLKGEVRLEVDDPDDHVDLSAPGAVAQI